MKAQQLDLFPLRVRATLWHASGSEDVTGSIVADLGDGYVHVRFDGAPEVGSHRGLTLLAEMDELEAA